MSGEERFEKELAAAVERFAPLGVHLRELTNKKERNKLKRILAILCFEYEKETAYITLLREYPQECPLVLFEGKERITSRRIGSEGEFLYEWNGSLLSLLQEMVYTINPTLYIDFHYQRLKTEQARSFYKGLLQEVMDGKYVGEHKLNVVDEENRREDLKLAIRALRYDRPEFFMLTGWKYRDYKSYFEVITDTYTEEQVNLIQKKLWVMIDEMTKDAKREEEIIDKIWKVYSWMSREMTYEDRDPDEEEKKALRPKDYRNQYNIVGPVERKKGVCMGFTSLFTIALRSLGIPTTFVSKEMHVWNMALIDGQHRHFDVTKSSVAISEAGRKKWFNLTTGQMRVYEPNILTEGV